MDASFMYSSSRVEEETPCVNNSQVGLAPLEDDLCFTSHMSSGLAVDCEFIKLPDIDIPYDSSAWDFFNPGLFTSTASTASTEPAFPMPASRSTVDDSSFSHIDCLPDPSSICSDTLLSFQDFCSKVSPPDTSFPETMSPSSAADPNRRLNWVKSTLRDIVMSRAAADPRPVPQQRKQMDASIAIYSELHNVLGPCFVEENLPYAPPMVWQQSSTSTIGSSFDAQSFSTVTGSPASSTGALPKRSPCINTSIPAKSASSAGPSQAAQPPITGGVQMVLDLNMNEATSLPRKHRPKTQEERRRYIAVRKQGACEWHRKQRKRCTCATSPVMDMKRKQAKMKCTRKSICKTPRVIQTEWAGDLRSHHPSLQRQRSGGLDKSLSSEKDYLNSIEDTSQRCSGQFCSSLHCECRSRLDEMIPTYPDDYLMEIPRRSMFRCSRNQYSSPCDIYTSSSPMPDYPWDYDPGVSNMPSPRWNPKVDDLRHCHNNQPQNASELGWISRPVRHPDIADGQEIQRQDMILAAVSARDNTLHNRPSRNALLAALLPNTLSHGIPPNDTEALSTLLARRLAADATHHLPVTSHAAVSGTNAPVSHGQLFTQHPPVVQNGESQSVSSQNPYKDASSSISSSATLHISPTMDFAPPHRAVSSGATSEPHPANTWDQCSAQRTFERSASHSVSVSEMACTDGPSGTIWGEIVYLMMICGIYLTLALLSCVLDSRRGNGLFGTTSLVLQIILLTADPCIRTGLFWIMLRPIILRTAVLYTGSGPGWVSVRLPKVFECVIQLPNLLECSNKFADVTGLVFGNVLLHPRNFGNHTTHLKAFSNRTLPSVTHSKLYQNSRSLSTVPIWALAMHCCMALGMPQNALHTCNGARDAAPNFHSRHPHHRSTAKTVSSLSPDSVSSRRATRMSSKLRSESLPLSFS
ncbi:uncharacterized protein PADG_12116 [Paracoccidioides brasiliensis Pb18]|uniref:Uncharacterized protein n=1 Tax=Paracoccidioides brasiliensis (strain Pb18) TaxID=502780 RepID=A0A0A0HUW6_PARBD|nr:uncharacterized protein PADG_12116 [Paracoccidioides brasiliensis Pb18]KGM91801.1 hypothetical protein PADG_12116 [Paracoccidioides brasiliensis Pb18]